MTRGPRPVPPAERALTAADIERLTDKLSVKIDGSEDRINDKLAEARAQADARQVINREARAQDQARIDALAEEVARQGRRGEEILASQTRGYRTLEAAQSETKETVELRLHALEDKAIPAASEIAAHTVEQIEQGGQRRSNRQAGLTLAAIGTAAGAAFMGVLNFIANHPGPVLKVLHVVSLGLVKVTATPHE